eukprot:gene1166-534_t
MTWHCCAVYGCSNTTRRKVQWKNKCKVKNPKQPCTLHERTYPELSRVDFHPFPDDKDQKSKWFNLCKRKGITLKDITRNYTVCSVHFEGGAGCTKMYPVPIHHSPESPLYVTPPNQRKSVLNRVKNKRENHHQSCESSRQKKPRVAIRSLDLNVPAIANAASETKVKKEHLEGVENTFIEHDKSPNMPSKEVKFWHTGHNYSNASFTTEFGNNIGTQTQ